MIKRTIVNLAAIGAAAVLAGFGVATVTVGGPAVVAEVAQQDRVYQFPANELAGAHACFRAERAERDIPGEMTSYLNWWNTATRAERDDWSSAYQACKDANLWRAGKWNFSNMILVSGG